MVKGKTKSGFKFNVDEGVCKSYEFIENLSQLQTGGLGLFSAVNDLLGSEQKAALLEHCRDESGHAPFEKVVAEFDEIVGIVRDKSDEVKN